MSSVALIIKHKTQPGRREDVRRIWERYMPKSITENHGHLVYYYCFDNNDPDSICAFQEYSSVEESQSFLKTENYITYTKEVATLLVGPPEVTILTPIWTKKISRRLAR